MTYGTVLKEILRPVKQQNHMPAPEYLLTPLVFQHMCVDVRNVKKSGFEAILLPPPQFVPLLTECFLFFDSDIQVYYPMLHQHIHVLRLF